MLSLLPLLRYRALSMPLQLRCCRAVAVCVNVAAALSLPQLLLLLLWIGLVSVPGFLIPLRE